MTLLSTTIVMGYHFPAVNWVVKASQRSLQESMLPSRKVLNHVIADPVKVSAKNTFFSTPRCDDSLAGCLHIQRVNLGLWNRPRSTILKDFLKTLGSRYQRCDQIKGSFFALEMKRLGHTSHSFKNG